MPSPLRGWKWASFVAVSAVAMACGGGSDGKQLLPAPLNVSATPGVYKMTIRWDPVAGATSYNLYVSSSPGITKALAHNVGVTSPYTFIGQSAGLRYYAVTAVDAQGESPLSTEVSEVIRLVAFVTSTTGTGNLSSWAGATGTGVAAGDSICQARAVAAGLIGAEYVAWLSDGTTDAPCHLRGLTGKLPNCGLGAPPTSATGPWTRTDGAPFGDGIDAMLGTSGWLYVPMRFDEFGAKVTLYPGPFTATDYFGGLASGGESCGGWTTSSSANIVTGTTYKTAVGWTEGSITQCNGTARLLCFETGSVPIRAPWPVAGRRAFITSTGYTGNLGGLAGADAACQARATAGALSNPTRFKAWLSTSTVNAKDRLTSGGPWVRVDGIPFANSLTDLTSSTLFTGLAVDEFGGHAMDAAYTGTGSAGLVEGTYTCSDWTYGGATGPPYAAGGLTDSAYSDWTYGAVFFCNGPARLYCFED
jgi:hypothetical protein